VLKVHRGSNYCPLNERVVDVQKAEKEAAASFNVPIVGLKYHAIRLRGLPAECPSLNHN
jgi:hypothetical protein